jgi:hypothetical protein
MRALLLSLALAFLAFPASAQTTTLYSNSTTGNVGIGTTSPQSLVHAYGGEVQVGSSAASCAAANGGAIRFSGSTLYYCDGSSAWQSVTSSAGGLPALTSADIWVGNGSNVPTAVAMSGDCTIANTGAITCTKTNGTAFGTLATQYGVNLSSQATGTLQAGQFPALTGDVTTTAGSLATTVAAIQGTTVGGTTGTGNVVFSANQTLTGTITAAAANFSGNVGIGTTSPATALQVVGTITATALGNGVTASTQSAGDTSTQVATDAFVNTTALTLANGTTATTQSPGDNSTKVATTAYVTANGGFSSCTIVTNVGSTTASCAAGYTMTGGGCAAFGVGVLTQSYPSASGTWTCTDTSGTPTTYAICCH